MLVQLFSYSKQQKSDTMSQNETVEVLNDLIKINNDRVAGYQNAIDNTPGIDVDLKAIFRNMANESLKYSNQLKDEVVKLGGEPATGTTLSGKIYRAWDDVKASFSGNDRQSVLNSCEFGEDAAQKAYKAALSSDAELPAALRQTIMDQQTALKKSHDLIKSYRDANKAVSA
jgi:uncharacterized protein (TIGR02284 family)